MGGLGLTVEIDDLLTFNCVWVLLYVLWASHKRNTFIFDTNGGEGLRVEIDYKHEL